MAAHGVLRRKQYLTTAEFWMDLQKSYELRLAERALPGKVIKHIEQHRDALVSA
jgi:plasmid maintenance system antidote protein VapI